MKYKNISGMRQVVVISGVKTQILSDDVFESDRELKIAFLERVSDDSPVTVKPGKRFSSVVNLQQKVTSLEQRQQVVAESSNEVKSLKDENTQLKEQVKDMLHRQEKLENETNRKLEMMKTAIMMLQEDFYAVEFDENGKAVEKDATFPQ